MSSSYKDLRVWQQAMKLTLEIYKASDGFPRKEQYQLTSQMCRSAISVPSNIAEGKGRQTDKEFIQFLHIARGSLYELETQIQLAIGLKFLDENATNKLLKECEKIGRALNGLIRALQGKSKPMEEAPE